MLPKHLEKAILDKATSLGDHPAVPQDEETPFLMGIVQSEYDAAADAVPEGFMDDRKTLAAELDRLTSDCMKIEAGSREALCAVCCDVLAEMFEIPDDTIDISVELVDRCDMSKFRIAPEPVRDFQFYDADDMSEMSDRVYQRRAVDALVAGAAVSCSSDFSLWRDRVASVDPRLPDMYGRLMRMRRALLFLTEDSVSSTKRDETGCVDVTIPSKGERVGMHAEGVVFPRWRVPSQ